MREEENKWQRLGSNHVLTNTLERTRLWLPAEQGKLIHLSARGSILRSVTKIRSNHQLLS